MTVIPFEPEEWLTMLCYKNSIRYMKEKDSYKYRYTISKESNTYKNMIKDIVAKAA